jgi:hypothetical protein
MYGSPLKAADEKEVRRVDLYICALEGKRHEWLHTQETVAVKLRHV